MKMTNLVISLINKTLNHPNLQYLAHHTLGNSRPQNQAIALAVEEAVLVDFQDQPSKQGSAVSGWILLDYGKLSLSLSLPPLSLPFSLSTHLP